MITVQFLAEWAVRSSILILSGAVLLWVLRVKDSSIRLAAWTAMLCGSLAIPTLTSALPGVPLRVVRSTVVPVDAPAVFEPGPALPATTDVRTVESSRAPFDLGRAALILYALAALGLLLRLCVGMAMSRRLLRGSRATGRTTEGIEIRESDRVSAPVTLGIVRPVIVLPADWCQWEGATLDAVLAHERSHIRRFDPAVQLLSAVHRALLWFSPVSWFLHSRIVRVAEEASDDAAVAVTQDRALYAELLLQFMQRGVCGVSNDGVPMARYGRADARIHRILDSTVLSRGVTRRGVVAILVLGSPLAYVVATGHPQSALQQNVTPQSPAPLPAAMAPAIVPVPAPAAESVRRTPPRVIAQVAPPAVPPAAPVSAYALKYLVTGLGDVTATTVTVRSMVDGQLMSVSFREGEQVQAGQVVALIDPRAYQIQVERAEAQVASDEKLLAFERQREQARLEGADVPQRVEYDLKADQAKLKEAQLQLANTQITAPITGMAGLRLVEPGSIIHASDAGGIVTIAQLQPIAVLFTLPEDCVPLMKAALSSGKGPEVEAWNRDSSVKIATGRLVAMDNQIDQSAGTVKLKAMFDNKDGALFPSEFVNVRVARQ
jgi:multidrug efflux pump subunit AcrA (membrane-fusion protein)/beta-lactamase regulating signal transducer with metallopeptidase domain